MHPNGRQRKMLLSLGLLICRDACLRAAAFQQGVRGKHLPLLRGEGNRRRNVPEWRLGRRKRCPVGQGEHQKRVAPLRMALIGPEEQWQLYSVVMGTAALGMRLQRTTKVGRALSGAVSSMLVAALMVNVGILPVDAPSSLGALQSFVVELATPLLLLQANLRSIWKDTGRLLSAFCVAAVGTVCGAVLAVGVLSPFLASTMAASTPLGASPDTWAALSALTAKNIGGGLNFVAVADTLKMRPELLTVSLAVDNVMGLLYFPLVSWLGRNEKPQQQPQQHSQQQDGPVSPTATSSLSLAAGAAEEREGIKMETSLGTVALGMALAAAAGKLSVLVTGSAALALPVSTFLAVAMATIVVPVLKLDAVAKEGQRLGTCLLYMFFAGVGASSGAVSSLGTPVAAALLAFLAILYATHLSVVLLGQRVFGFDLRESLVASNASIGNPATASALAAAQGWSRLVAPALLVGTLGNAVGTFVGLGLGLKIFEPLLLARAAAGI